MLIRATRLPTCTRNPVRTVLLAASAMLLLAPAAPALAADFFVNNNNDAGDNSIGDGDCWTGGFVLVGMFGVFECTLRAAIQETNALAGSDTIGFSSLLNVNVFGTVVISVTSPLPNITGPLTIDGTTAPTYDPFDPDEIPVIVLDGGLLGGAGDDGLHLTESADSSTILGLAIIRFPSYGINLNGADLVRIDASHIGLDRGFVVRGNGKAGINAFSNSSATTIGKAFDPVNGFEGSGNVISGNGRSGIRTNGPTTLIAGNKIGTDRFGNAVVNGGGNHANGRWGVEVTGSTPDSVAIGRVENLMGGGPQVASGNVIAGNTLGGILADGAMTNLEIKANHIGIGFDGTTALGNGLGPGIRLFADGVDVGEAGVGGNVISGHSTDGVQIGDDFGQDPQDTRVIGNRIGTNAAGDATVGNAVYGVYMADGMGTEVSHNIVGGNTQGIWLVGNDNEVLANYVGTNASGDDLGNAATGIFVEGDSNEVGREGGLGNVIGFNFNGIEDGPFTSSTKVFGNFIGTDAAGNDLGNQRGMSVRGDDDVIGGTLSGRENVIGHNTDYGLLFVLSPIRVQVIGNFIGTNGVGADLGNGSDGVHIGEAFDITIGSNSVTPDVDLAARKNVIAFNGGAGIRLPTAGSPSNPNGTGNAWRGNQLQQNVSIPVDLGPLGSTPNDFGDPDMGRNNLQNSPAIDPAQSSYDSGGNLVQVRYRVESDVTNSAYPIVVDFYQVASDGEEPFQWLGSDSYLAGEAGLDVDTSFTPAVAVPSSFEMLAIATDDDDNSSETGNIVSLPEPGLAAGLACGWALLAALRRRRNLVGR